MSNDVVCLPCMKPVAPDDPCLTCKPCGHYYHVGKCSGVTKKGFKAMSAEVLDTWLCPTCNSRELKSHVRGRAGSSAHASSTGSDDEPSLSAVMAKLDMVLQRLNALERNQEEQLAKHRATNDTIVKQAETIQSMEASLETLSLRYDDIVLRLKDRKRKKKT